MIETPEDGVDLHVAVLPTGDYPHHYEFEESGKSVSLSLKSRMPVGPPRSRPRGTIIAVHGWRLEHRALLFHAMKLATEGWEVVLYDQRGHGRSGGKQITFGKREGRDLQAVVDWARSREHFSPPLVLFGTSMGGSTALMAAAEIEPSAVVAVAPYARLDDVLPAAVRRFAPFFLRPFLTERRLDDALLHVQQLSGVPLQEMAPIGVAERVSAPVLLIHSRDDGFVPPRHGPWLHERLPDSTLHEVENLSHEALLADRDLVLEVALPWLDEVLERNACSGRC